MNAKNFSCAFLVAVLVFAGPASAQWSIHFQDESGGAWRIVSPDVHHEGGAEFSAKKSCDARLTGVPAPYATKVVGPAKETVFVCSALFASSGPDPQTNPTKVGPSTIAPPATPATPEKEPVVHESELPSLDALIQNPNQTLKKLAGGWFNKSRPIEKTKPAPTVTSAPVVKSTVYVPSSTTLPARPTGAAPMTYYFIMLHALRGGPELFSEETWNKLTAQQIKAAKSMYSKGGASEMEAVFTAEQVKDRNPEMAAAELAPILKADLAARANAAPDMLVAQRALVGVRYDDSVGKLVSECCFGRPRVRPGWFDLLQPALELVSGVPSDTPAGYQPSPGLPPRAQSMAVYEMEENLGAKESGPVPALAYLILSGGRLGFRPDQMDIALDRWVEIDGIPMARGDAEKLMNALRPPRKIVETRVTFAPTGADKGSSRAVLYGKLVSASIVGPNGETIATFPAEAFPRVSEGP